MSANNMSINRLITSLERVLIFREVFNQHINTCENIITGNCLARDTLQDLKVYLSKNLNHFDQLVQSLHAASVPRTYQRELDNIVQAVKHYRNAIEDLIDTISPECVDRIPFRIAVRKCRMFNWLNGAYIDAMRMQAGQFSPRGMVG